MGMKNRRNDPAAQFAVLVETQTLRNRSKIRMLPPAPPTPSDYERLMGMLPKTSSENIGFHGIPDVPTLDRAPPQKLGEYESLKATMPSYESRVLGHHPTYLKDRHAAVDDAKHVVNALGTRDVSRDAELSGALRSLRSRVKQLELKKVRPSHASRCLHGTDR